MYQVYSISLSPSTCLSSRTRCNQWCKLSSFYLQHQSCHVAQFKLPSGYAFCIVSQLTGSKAKADIICITDIICTTVCEHAELESTLPKLFAPTQGAAHSQTLRLTLSAASWAPPCTTKHGSGLLKVATAARKFMKLTIQMASQSTGDEYNSEVCTPCRFKNRPEK